MSIRSSFKLLCCEANCIFAIPVVHILLASPAPLTRTIYTVFATQVLARFERAKQIDIKGDATIYQLAQLALEMEAEEQMVCHMSMHYSNLHCCNLLWHRTGIYEYFRPCLPLKSRQFIIGIIQQTAAAMAPCVPCRVIQKVLRR